MKEIKLTQGYVTQVDDKDYEWLNKYKWGIHKGGYAITVCAGNKHILMHRLILNITDPKIEIDHKDRNPLNNQRNNLRTCNRSQNMANKTALSTGKSKYLGVYERKGYWIAACQKDNKMHVKTYRSEREAALAYNEMAKEYHGEYANPNVIDETIPDRIFIEKKKKSGCTSIYHGVSYDKNPSVVNKWIASCVINRTTHKKRCSTEIEAALAYNEFAKLRGKTTYINVIIGPTSNTQSSIHPANTGQ